MKKRMNRAALLAAAVLSLGAVGCAGAAQPQTGAVQQAAVEVNQVTVTGKSTIPVVPDIAKMVFSVESQGVSAEDTQKENSEKINAVIEVLKAAGVDEKSIQTSDYSLYPQYDYNDGMGQRISGYQVSNTLSVTDLKMDQLGEIMTKCVQAGINNVRDITYSTSKFDETYKEAMQKAVEDAAQRAEALAKASGKELGEVKSLQEGYVDESTRYIQTGSMLNGLSSAEKADNMVILPGQQDVHAEVSVTYTLK